MILPLRAMLRRTQPPPQLPQLLQQPLPLLRGLGSTPRLQLQVQEGVPRSAELSALQSAGLVG